MPSSPVTPSSSAKPAYAPMRLSPAAHWGLVGLRLFLTLTTVMAVIAFVHGLKGG